MGNGKKGLAALGDPPGDLPAIPLLVSPNQGSRQNRKVDLLIWHYTAGPTGSGAINWMRAPESKVSAHFVIDRNGRTTQLVPLNRAAWHAGDSSINARSIGVEVTNVGQVQPDGKGGWLYQDGPGLAVWRKDAEPVRLTLKWPGGKSVSAWWVPYTPQQEQAMRELVQKLEKTGYAPAAYDMRGHEDIAEPVGRKSDPGPLFPWAMWPGRYEGHKTTVIVPERVA